jgi:hypothetical protein
MRQIPLRHRGSCEQWGERGGSSLESSLSCRNVQAARGRCRLAILNPRCVGPSDRGEFSSLKDSLKWQQERSAYDTSNSTSRCDCGGYQHWLFDSGDIGGSQVARIGSIVFRGISFRLPRWLLRHRHRQRWWRREVQWWRKDRWVPWWILWRIPQRWILRRTSWRVLRRIPLQEIVWRREFLLVCILVCLRATSVLLLFASSSARVLCTSGGLRFASSVSSCLQFATATTRINPNYTAGPVRQSGPADGAGGCGSTCQERRQ